MDIIYIHNLKIDTIIGIFDWERKVKQTVIFDLDLGTDIKLAASHDDIEYTLDYKSVAKRLIDYISNSEFKLVETLAEKVSKLLLSEYDIKWLRLRVNKKGAIRYADNVGVMIERKAK